ncbi:MAG: DUF697 domain-containing protein [Pirellulales bacterium]|nr:DUF697 domain-containing protein [Pirellulales bacterium]
MSFLPRKLGLVLLAFAAGWAYAAVAWFPTIVDIYQRVHAQQPWLAYSYLSVVGAGGLTLAGLTVGIIAHLWKNSAAKAKNEARRSRDPSALSTGERRDEIADNLAAGRDFAESEHADPAVRTKLREAIVELESKQSAQRLEIAAFGTISSGKSTLLNALAGRDAFSTNVVGGTTTMRSELPWPGADRVTLVDTPGLAEVRGEARAAEAAAVAQNADLVLLVVDGPLKAYEVELAEALLAMEKRLIVCLNKEDWYDARQESELTAQIAEQLPGVAREDVVAVRAGATQRPQVRVLADGCEETVLVDVPPNVEPLARRMLAVVKRDGGDLLLANLLLQSRGMVDEAKRQVRARLDERAEEIVSRSMWVAGGAAGINPIPLLDLAGGSAITLKMVLDLAKVYQQPLDVDLAAKMLEGLSKNLIAMVGATAATPALAGLVGSLLKTVPGIGTLAGGLVQGLVQALVTKWIGRVFIAYLQNEMKPPEGGLAETARREWSRVTTPEELKKLIHLGRSMLRG